MSNFNALIMQVYVEGIRAFSLIILEQIVDPNLEEYKSITLYALVKREN